ncbi:hypothetical protein NP493_760g01052 [Ridgeia piscesae]|uniref:Tetraspanin n=1 Tax=Ridgeia piscesae TaxID=27915 RepID=A0AAD9KQX8_RIDPI|nr:hypothetical protein NP493_760g01052 [Ridgeia piscesae]
MAVHLPPVKLDAVCVLISGIVSLLTVFNFRRDLRTEKLSLIAIDPQGSDVIRWAVWVIAVSGASSLVLPLLRRRRKAISFNKYVGVLAALLCVNFIVGLVLTIYKIPARSGLADGMRLTLKETRVSLARFGVGFYLSDAWDYLQIEMKCCGVDGYSDYMRDTWDRRRPVPSSCCVRTAGPLPLIENEAQCQTDATLRHIDSVFLYTRGCRRSLTAWLSRRVTVIMVLLFLVVCLQATAVLYLSWRGYMKHSTARENDYTRVRRGD